MGALRLLLCLEGKRLAKVAPSGKSLQKGALPALGCAPADSWVLQFPFSEFSQVLHFQRYFQPDSLGRRFRMAIETTLSIIKPDAVRKNLIGKIVARFEAAGLQVVAARMLHLSRREAEAFYAVHRERPFFKDLVEFMVSGPIFVQALCGEAAIARNRDLMGATDPKKAALGTIRADFADSIDANAVHGSDSPDTARVEVAFFFPTLAIHRR